MKIAPAFRSVSTSRGRALRAGESGSLDLTFVPRYRFPARPVQTSRSRRSDRRGRAGYRGARATRPSDRAPLEERAEGVGEVEQVIGQDVRFVLGIGQLEHFRQPEQPHAQAAFGGVGQRRSRGRCRRIASGANPPLRKMLWIRA